jgi:uncharacterized protein
MSDSRTSLPDNRRPLMQRVVARHPVAAFVVIVLAVNFGVALSPTLTRRDLLPFDQAPYDWLAHILGCALSAFLITGATEGRAGMRRLARRCLRWRVGVRWYLLALLGVPLAALLIGIALFGAAPLQALAAKWLLLVTVVLPHLLLVIVFSNVAEEIGWTGFLFDGLQERHAPLTASAIVALPFAAAHLPGWFVEFGSISLALYVGAIMLIPHWCSRIIAAWFYNGTGGSVLLVGLFHCSFNVTTAEFGRGFITSSGDVLFFVTSGIVITAGTLIAALTKGRLSYQASHYSPALHR